MAIKPSKLKKTRKVLNLTDERPLYATGNKTSVISIPKYFIRTLGWTPGRTTLIITLNSDSSLNLRALPSKKTGKKGQELPLFPSPESKTT